MISHDSKSATTKYNTAHPIYIHPSKPRNWNHFMRPLRLKSATNAKRKRIMVALVLHSNTWHHS